MKKPMLVSLLTLTALSSSLLLAGCSADQMKDKVSEGANKVTQTVKSHTDKSDKTKTDTSDTAKTPSGEGLKTTPLTWSDKSNVSEGATKYGAIIQLGELDSLGRSTSSHILLKNDNEPGFKDPKTHKPREKRNETISVNPKGWKNFKIDGKWANNRCHLVGYQFSGLNDELRNLVTGTSYLNKGTDGNGMDQDNPAGMLFYEQKLDKWLGDNPTYSLDYAVKPIYTGNNLTPSAVYMQWMGYDANNKPVAIHLGGQSKSITPTISTVVLSNMSPAYNINYATGQVTAK